MHLLNGTVMNVNANDRTHKELQRSNFEHWKNDSTTEKRI
jgi:hypothetical protein